MGFPIRKRRFQFSLAFLLVILLGVAIFFAIRPQVRAYYAVKELSNSDMVLNGTPFGLMIYIEGPASEELLALGNDANPWLVKALSDKDKFAAAHYLLTRINKEEFEGAQEYWDEFHLDPLSAGSMDFDESLMPGLQEFWTKFFSNRFTNADRQLDFSYYRKAKYGFGDWVPCDEEDGKLLLTIRVRHDDKTFFVFKQTFCRHHIDRRDPAYFDGMSPCELEYRDDPPNGMRGVYQFSKLSADQVGIKMDWYSTTPNPEHRFRAEWIMKIGEEKKDSRDTAGGYFDWSLTPIPQKEKTDEGK